MHTLLMTSVGLAILALFMGTAWPMKGASWTLKRAAQAFIPLWLIISVGNMLVGMFSAGVPFLTELVVFLVVFGVPAVTAWFLGRTA
jgi:hypothetical protein